MDFITQQCVKITAETTAMPEEAIIKNLDRLKDWRVKRDEGGFQLRKQFDLASFEEVVKFIAEVGKAANTQRHFPNFQTRGSSVTVTWWSAAIEGLHLNDFIMAAQTDDIYSRWDVISGQRDEVEEASDESFPASDAPGW